ncbi:hypothetical protein AB8A05_29260 [Tardiphaga sp. 538_B7_N1_4]|uniref:hypothetical protein n=1 Tax=Tardiphaga sp. 538_B7_N1_4 TaxID=3240778 RepID=UPI003F2134D1
MAREAAGRLGGIVEKPDTERSARSTECCSGEVRRELPAHILAEIKLGTKAEKITSSPRRQLLTNAQVRAIVEAAYEVDADGDFGRLVLLTAETLTLFVRFWLTITPPLPNDAQAAAQIKGRERFGGTCF